MTYSRNNISPRKGVAHITIYTVQCHVIVMYTTPTNADEKSRTYVYVYVPFQVSSIIITLCHDTSRA